MTINEQNAVADPRRLQGLMAAGSLLGALAASSCCIAPLLLFSLGVSGAWIGNLTWLAPYQPYFIAGAFACLGYGYWLIYRASRHVCCDGQACAPSRLVRAGLILATVLVVAALAFDFVGPIFLPS